MHSFEAPSGRTYFHDGDFSGEVRVEAKTLYNELVEVEIPFEDIRALYLAYLRRKQISALEQAEGDELEALLFRVEPEHRQPASPQLLRQAIAPEPPLEPTGELVKDYMYMHCQVPDALARIDGLGPEGTVLFSVWDPKQPYGWQGGAGFNSHADFRDIYPFRYRGAEPVAQKFRE